MGNGDLNRQKDHGVTKKTPFQLQSLETFYLENNYPEQSTMKGYAASLNLTYTQIRKWFVDRRRKEKRENVTRCSNKKGNLGNGRGQAPRCTGVECFGDNRNETNAMLVDQRQRKVHLNDKRQVPRNYPSPLQILYSKDYILKRVFRKDGPLLGVEFDTLPEDRFRRGTTDLHSCRDSQRNPKRRKVMEFRLIDPGTPEEINIPAKKYGIGKGLMTAWHAINSNSRKSPTSTSSMNEGAVHTPLTSTGFPEETICRVSKILQRPKPVMKQKTTQKRVHEKRKPPLKERKVATNKRKNRKKLHPTECILSVDELKYVEQSNVPLIDDEELELKELPATQNIMRCSAHLASNGRHGCQLCKDLLARFPPDTVKMKQPFCVRPWDSSPELIKKLFKVFRFLYNHATIVEVCPFSLDEFAQAFHDKDSLLLGQIHVSLIKMLLLDAEREVTSEYIPRPSKDCRFLGFLHFVRQQEVDVNFWSQALNPLTWIEILRQVLIAAGFGSKNIAMRRDLFSKEMNRMAKYGLRHRTLKGELFSMLSEKGTSGSKVSVLAKSPQIVALNLPDTEELEQLICSTLSSDITLFEKIAPSAYRLRVDPRIKGKEDSQSDEDSGSVDNDSGDSSDNSSTDESDDSEALNSTTYARRIVKYKARNKKCGQKVSECTEIDESYTGEAWVLGLMEGEYSNLSIEEKLDALVALVDLSGASFSFRMEEQQRMTVSVIPDKQYHGSGAKIKKSSTSHHLVAREAWEGPARDVEETLTSDNYPNHSKARNSSDGVKNNNSTEEVHSLRSIYLGSDRRYNSYWLFLGPCDPDDPGHRRVYFESSEDGHWEVIDTAQDIRALLSVLDCRGSRESHLFSSLEMREAVLCQAMDDYMSAKIGKKRKGSDQTDADNRSGYSSSPISDVNNTLIPAESTSSLLAASGAIYLELGKTGREKEQIWDRLQAFDNWIWNSFYLSLNAVKNCKRSFMESLTRCGSCHDLYWRDEKHCKICHSTFVVDFDLEERYAIHVATCRETEDSCEFPKHKVYPSQLQALKAAIHAIELSLPEEALAGAWKGSGHKLWVKRLRRTSCLVELLQVLNDFVGAVNEEWLHECALALGSNMALDEIVVYFQTMPQTTSAVALWMVKLDALIGPHLKRHLCDGTAGSISQSKRKSHAK